MFLDFDLSNTEIALYHDITLWRNARTLADVNEKAVKPSVIILNRTSRLRAVPDKPALAFP